MATLMSDTFTGTDGTAWSTSNWTSNGTGTGGEATILSNAGTCRSGTAGSYGASTPTMRSANITSPTDVIISGTWKPDANEPYGSVYARSVVTGADNQSGYVLQLNKNGTITLLQVTGYGGAGSATLGSFSFAASSNTIYGFKLSCVGSTIRCKVWSGSEPGTWDVSVTDTVWTTAGKVGVRVAGGGAAVQHIITFDDIVVDDGTSGVNITPSAISCTTSVATPVPHASAVHTATAVQSTTAVPAPAPHASISLTATAVAGSTTVPAPGLTASGTASPAAIAGVTAVPAPTLAAGQGAVISPSAVLAATAAATPLVGAGAGISPTAVACSTAVPAPVVSFVVPVPVVALLLTTSVPAPVTGAGAGISPTAVQGSTQVPAPTLSNEVILAVVAVQASTVVPAPAVHAGVHLVAVAVLAAAVVPSPSVMVSVVLMPAAILGSTAVPATTVSQGVTLRPAAIRALAVIPAALVRAISTRTPDGARRGGWGSLLAIYHEERALAAFPPPLLACPNDGTPLRAGPHGERFCPFDGFQTIGN